MTMIKIKRPPLPRKSIAGLLLLSLMVLGYGCKEGSGNQDHPEPGTMQVISVTPVQDVRDLRSLIPASTFEDWHAGAAAPSSNAIILPQGNSSISRATDDAITGFLSIKETWKGKNSVWRPERRFAVQVNGLQPHRKYRLKGAAKTIGDSNATLEVYGMPDEKSPLWHMALKWIKIEAKEGWQPFEGTFNTGEITSIRITTAHYEDRESEEPNIVLWDNWRLIECGPAHWPEIKATKENLIPNGSFEVWVPGEAAPRGPFIAPNQKLGHSRLSPMQVTHPDGNSSLRQDWVESDQADEAKNLFGVQVFLDANTDYTFSMRAHMTDSASISIQVYGIDQDQQFHPIDEALIEVKKQNAWSKYAGQFNTGAFKKLRIVVRSRQSTYPCHALFDAWQLGKAKN